MDEVLDKEALGRELAAGIAQAQQIRAARAGDPCPQDHRRLKEWQAGRLARSYADLLADPRYRPAAEFFLNDLYGPHDFRSRDAELARVVPILTRLLPVRALQTLVAAVRMDVLSESLDTAMVCALRQAGCATAIDAPAYAQAYRRCGRRADREQQIELIGRIGAALDQLTRLPLLQASLKIMKKPAELSGVGGLHSFLQRGFDAFRRMGGAERFLAIVAERETALLRSLFEEPPRR